MSESILQEVLIENAGQYITLYLTPADAARVTTDKAFALRLLNKYGRQRIAENHRIANDAMPVKDVVSPASLVVSELKSSPANSSVQENVEDSIIESDKTSFMWPSKYVYLFMQKYEERMNEFSSDIKRHSKIWESIASDMNKVDPMVAVSGTQCQSKMNSLKKMYRKVIDHNNISGNDRKSWHYFERMDELFGKSGWANPKSLASDAGPSSPATSTDENKNNEEPATKKLKSEKVLDEFMKQIKQDRQEREKKREERKLAVLTTRIKK
ncbi:unnamed protein product [Lasius platythorax]|uniref:Myb/SANT-like DNA-binding domain-containing protein n=1 Tax=Lasius platythorax TaxID=488582 RepID=A0AAV2MYJ0_9HYME